MTKLVIQIPCYNEEETLPVTLEQLPREVRGVDRVEILVVDDGSADRTVEAARASGADHIVRLPAHQGLATAFTRGLDAAIRLGADVIVNTDADNQYRSDDIHKLIAPILSGSADIVVGERPIEQVDSFSWFRKRLQRLGSWVVRRVSGTDVRDATSGFRAMSRSAAGRLHVFNDYTYTLETIIQAGMKGMRVASVPIRVNPDLRPSRLIGSVRTYLRKQVTTILRIFVLYKPFTFFASIGAATFLAGFLISVRFIYFFAIGEGAGHVQSLILSALLMGSGLGLGITGLVSDLIASNRQLLEKLDSDFRALHDRRAQNGGREEE